MAIEAKKDESERLKIYFLPNLMTAGNLFCGFLALTKVIFGPVFLAALVVFLLLYLVTKNFFYRRAAGLQEPRYRR